MFGRIGDLVGRKYTFLVTIMIMGSRPRRSASCRPTPSVGMLSPIILVLLRLAQGLALGGEYGGAATYVAEHAPDAKRGLHTSWIQTTATLGFFLSLVVIGTCRLVDGRGGRSSVGLADSVPASRSSCSSSRSTSGSS